MHWFDSDLQNLIHKCTCFVMRLCDLYRVKLYFREKQIQLRIKFVFNSLEDHFGAVRTAQAQRVCQMSLQYCDFTRREQHCISERLRKQALFVTHLLCSTLWRVDADNPVVFGCSTAGPLLCFFWHFSMPLFYDVTVATNIVTSFFRQKHINDLE